MRLRGTATTKRALALAASALAVLLFAAPPADAHRFSVRRALFLETADTNVLHIVVAIRIPTGDRRRAFDLFADQNHDGRYSDAERAQVRALLSARALDGLAIRTATATLELRGVEVKEKIEPGDGPVEVMVHATALFSGSELTVTTGNVGDPLDLLVLPGTRKVLESSRGQVRDGGLELEMGLGDRVRFRVTS